MPDWLSELYPKYLQDPQLLLCPADKTKGQPAMLAAYKDPNLPCSYVYDFNPMKFLYEWGLFEKNPPKNLTFKERKTRELKYWGNLVPVVECLHHGVQCIRLGYDGKIRLSSLDGWGATPEAIGAVLSFFQRAIAENPDGWEREYSLKEIYGWFRWPANRLPDFQNLLEKASTLSVEGLKILAEIYQAEGKIHEAIETYKRVIIHVPDDVETRIQLAKLFATEKNYGAARTEVEGVLQFDPKNESAYRRLTELDAVSDANRQKQRFETVRETELHYLLKLEERLWPKAQTLLPTVRKAREVLKEGFGEPEAVTRLSHLYQTVDKSLASRSGGWKIHTTSDGLINDIVYATAQDQRGILWIGTQKGVCQYDGERFTPFTRNEELRESNISSIFRHVSNFRKNKFTLCMEVRFNKF